MRTNLYRILLIPLSISLNFVPLQRTFAADTNEPVTYDAPHPLDFVKKAPGDIAEATKRAFRKEAIPTWVWVTATTGLLIVYDQKIIDEAQRLGDRLSISHTQYQKTYFHIHFPLIKKDLNFEGPFDNGSALYFLGDGWVDVGIIGSFLGVGLATHNNRALQTSSQIAESILASGTVVQIMKHVTGRESPFTTDVPRGVWRFFPNQSDYAQHVPSYDAFPSGHLTAAMATVTVIGENYPEYRFVRPVGYSLITVLGFQMLNNGVHWASDYPLALAMGYSFGRIAVKKGRTKKNQKTTLNLYPVPLPHGGAVVAQVRFAAKK